MLDWLIPNRTIPIENISPYDINPKSTLHIQCQPADPHTASNIVITAYRSKQIKTIVPIRIQWSRSRNHQNFNENQQDRNKNQFFVQKIPYHKGNTYLCQPTDLGCYLNAKIQGLEDNCPGFAEVTIGPIRIDVMLKRLIEGALYSENLISQIVLTDNGKQKNATLNLAMKQFEIVEDQLEKKLSMKYNISEPKIQLSPKDPLRVYLRFEQDEQNNVSNYLADIFEKSKSNDLEVSQKSNPSSRTRLFRSVYCPNKLEIKFLSRHTRDLFLFSHKAFLCKDLMKTSVIFQKLENMQMLGTEADYNKFLQFITIRNQIDRLSARIKDVELDRDKKIADLNQLQQSIGELTLTYMKIIQEKSKQENIDLNKSYSQISMKRQEMLHKKNYRQLQQQNQSQKQIIRDLKQQIELLKFFKKEQGNNQSLFFNQTQNNPFKKSKQPNPFQDIEKIQAPKNMLELSRSYVKLLQQNQKLKQKNSADFSNIDKSCDMLQLLNNLKGSDSPVYQPTTADELKRQNLQLKKLLSEKYGNTQKTVIKNQSNKSRLSMSIAHQNQSILNASTSRIEPSGSSQSFISINPNQSLTSELQLKLLEGKLTQLSNLNQKLELDNSRLRDERNQLKQIALKFKNKLLQVETYYQKLKQQDKNDELKINDTSVVIRVKQQNESLINQRNALRKKIDSLLRQGTLQPNLQKQQIQKLKVTIDILTKQNNSLKQQLLQLREQLCIKQKRVQQLILQKANPQTSGQQMNKIKKINNQLLEQIKQLKIKIQDEKQKALNSSKIIQLEHQIKYLKGQGKDIDQSHKILLTQLAENHKEIEKLKKLNDQQQCKLRSQQNLIQRLMNNQDDSKSNHSTGSKGTPKDGKSLSAYGSQTSLKSIEKYKKKIAQLQQEVIMLRRSTDALNRSRDVSMDMQGYYEQQLTIVRKQNSLLVEQTQRLSKMCEKYAKQLRQVIKSRAQLLNTKKQIISFGNAEDNNK